MIDRLKETDEPHVYEYPIDRVQRLINDADRLYHQIRFGETLPDEQKLMKYLSYSRDQMFMYLETLVYEQRIKELENKQ